MRLLAPRMGHWSEESVRNAEGALSVLQEPQAPYSFDYILEYVLYHPNAIMHSHGVGIRGHRRNQNETH